MLRLVPGSPVITSAVLSADNSPVPLSTATVTHVGDAIRFDPVSDFDFLAAGQQAIVQIAYDVTDDAVPPATDRGQLTVTVSSSQRDSTGPNLGSGVAADVASDAWTTVTLDRSYASMVVVATPNYDVASVPLVARVRGASGNQFQLRLDLTDQNTERVTADVHYVVAEEGAYVEATHGITLDAVKYESSRIDHDTSWSGGQRNGLLSRRYDNPVVLGQVMSDRDSGWSAFWASSSLRWSPPDSTTIRTGLHVGEDPDTNRAAETVGLIVIEEGDGVIDGVPFVAAVRNNVNDVVRNGTQIDTGGVSNPTVVVASQASMKGGNGSWAMVYGPDALGDGVVRLAVDEDQSLDSERNHAAEYVSYFVLGPPSQPVPNTPPTANDDSYGGVRDEPLVVDATQGVLANDTDPNSQDPLTVSLVDGVQHGVVALQANGAFAYTPNAGFVGSDQFRYQVADGQGGFDVGVVDLTVSEPASGPKLHVGQLSDVSTQSWTTVTLPSTYSSMVVVSTLRYDATNAPTVVRIRNALGNQFEIKLDRTDGSAGSVTADVSYVVVEAGVYTEAEHGIAMEAVLYNSTVTDHAASWQGESQLARLQNTYAAPVVVGQVMTHNDSRWSAFWSQGTSRWEPVSRRAIVVGKHVGESPDVDRAAETIGYLVVESGSANFGDFEIGAGLGADTVDGIVQGGADYIVEGIADNVIAVASQSGMNGRDGSWAVIRDPSHSGQRLRLAVDEDQATDAERAHVGEHVAYLTFRPRAAAAVAVDRILAARHLSDIAAILDDDA